MENFNGNIEKLESLIKWKDKEAVPALNKIGELRTEVEVMKVQMQDLPHVKEKVDDMSQKINGICTEISNSTSRKQGRMETWTRIGAIITQVGAIVAIIAALWKMSIS